MRSFWMCLLLLTGGWSLSATACEDPVSPPAGLWDWGPLCTVVRADAHHLESVLGRTSADLSSTVQAGSSPFQTSSMTPLGFSKTGTFAWLRWDPPCGYTCGEAGIQGKWTIRVLDTKTGERTSAAVYPDAGGGLATLLSQHGEVVEAVVQDQAIDLGPPEVLALPAHTDGRPISVEWRPQGSAGRFSIWLREGAEAPRSVGQLELGDCRLCGPHAARLIPSPFDQTAVLVLVHFSARIEQTIPAVTYTVLPVRLRERAETGKPKPK